MNLITEYTDHSVEVITEAKDNGKKNYFIEGIFMQSEIKNRNGRVYPKEIMAKEVKRYCTEFVDQQRAFGELGHPEGPTINLDKDSFWARALGRQEVNFEELHRDWVRIGYLFLLGGLITGGLWAKFAWSDYWAWDPKENLVGVEPIIPPIG